MQHASQSYFAHQILTASPAKLHLMLLDGASRFVQQAIMHLENDGDFDRATDATVRALKIMSELLGALNPTHDESLVKRVAGEYVFVIRALSEGNLRHDPEELRGALRVLEVQRATWQQLNQRLVERTNESGPAAAVSGPHALRERTQSSFPAPSSAELPELPEGGSFSIDA
jgi:flagellar secretion chaperone FliS